MQAEAQALDRVLSSMCTEPHPDARAAAERFLATNPGDPGSFPSVASLEDRAVELLGEIAGLDRPAGYVASGGTEANIQAIRIARDRADVESPNVVMPASGHFSFRKAAGLLGVELRVVPTTADHRVDLGALEAAVDEETVAVVAVAGSTEYGRVDPVPAVAAIAREAGAMVHVDAAWGGFVLPFTDREWHFGHAPVDTMAIDPHKMGRAAVPAGGLLVRDSALLDAIAVDTPYLESTAQVTLTGTRSGAGVASAVAAMEALWPDGYRRQYETTLANAEWLAGRLADRGYPVVPPTLPLVAADLPVPTFDRLRSAGWRISRTAAGELRIVCMPHLERPHLESFLSAIDRLAVPAGATVAGDD